MCKVWLSVCVCVCMCVSVCACVCVGGGGGGLGTVLVNSCSFVQVIRARFIAGADAETGRTHGKLENLGLLRGREDV